MLAKFVGQWVPETHGVRDKKSANDYMQDVPTSFGYVEYSKTAKC